MKREPPLPPSRNLSPFTLSLSKGERSLRFALRMALREIRGSWRHFIFFLICIALGVGSLVGVGSFSANLERTIHGEARALSAADIRIASSHPLTPDQIGVLDDLEKRGVRRITIHEMVAMAAIKAGRSQLVELKVAEEGYPFYGQLETTPPKPLMELLREGGAVVQESLLIRLNAGVGDTIRIGEGRFTVRGIVRKEPDRTAGAFSLGPRVFIDPEGLHAAKLIQPGSRIHYRTLLRIPDGVPVEPLVEALKKRIPAPGMEIRSYEEGQSQLTRFLERLALYLGLAGLITLLVGGVGIAVTVRTFIQRKLDTIAVLKCTGAGTGTILLTYLIQALLLGAIGSLTGVALGVGIAIVLPPLLGDFLPFALDFHLEPIPILQGVGMGLLATFLFSFRPLLTVRNLPPSWILRREVTRENSRRKGRVFPWIVTLGIGSGLAGMAFYQAGSLKIGGIFAGAIAAAVFVLALTAWGVVRLLKALPPARSLPVRQGRANLLRPGSQTVPILLTLGIGGMLILTLVLVEGNLLGQLRSDTSRTVPSFFFIDIQPDQKEEFRELLRPYDPKGKSPLLPLVRSRLDRIGDQPVSSFYREEQEDSWYFTREYVLTFLDRPPEGNVVTRGEWWGDRRADSEGGAMPEISVEDEAASHLGVKVGSTMTFDLQGMTITAKVTSLRRVDWSGMTPNFFIIFQPGGLDPFPVSYVSAIRVPPEEEVPLQQRVVDRFPNVTAIPVREVLESVAAILERISLVVRFMALFSILTGLTVLVGALAATRYQRLRESALLKVIGATRSLIARSFAVEYAILGVAAGLISAVLAVTVDFIVARYVMEAPWSFQPGVLLTGVLAMVGITVGVGFLSTYRILGKRPLPVLRGE